MKWRILDDDGKTVLEGEGGELVAELEAGLDDSDQYVLEWRPGDGGLMRREVTIPMELQPLDRVDAQMLADLFDVPVEWLPS